MIRNKDSYNCIFIYLNNKFFFVSFFLSRWYGCHSLIFHSYSDPSQIHLCTVKLNNNNNNNNNNESTEVQNPRHISFYTYTSLSVLRMLE